MHRKCEKRQTLILVCSFLLGLTLGFWLSRNARIVRHVLRCQYMLAGKSRPQTLQKEVESNRSFLFVAVFINTQEYKTDVLYNDFTAKTNIKFIFFAIQTTISLHNRDVVYLDGMDASTKTELIYLRMFNHIRQHYHIKFNWFVFTESSFFINIDKLDFLRNLNDSKELLFLPQVIGRNNGSRIDIRGSNRTKIDHSTGETKEYLIADIFQPGMILSRTILQTLSTEPCMNKRNDFRECFQNRITVSWLTERNNTRSKEREILNSINCQSERKDLIIKSLTGDLSNNLECLYRLRVQLLSKRVRVLSKNYKILQTKLNSLQDFISSTVYEKISDIKTAAYKGLKQKVEFGTMFTIRKNFPIKSKVSWSLHNHQLKGITRIIRTVMDTISNAHHENIQFHALYYGYVLNEPISGLQYRLNIFTNKERHIARSRQEFGALQSRMLGTSQKVTVNIVIPLAGRLQNFKYFMENLEQNILKKHEPISVLVVYFPEKTSSTEHQKIFDKYKMTYNSSIFIWLNLPGRFARALALQTAVDFYKENKLLFFADVDLTFNLQFLQRCRDNTISKKRLYFPVMFKLFNPKILGFTLNFSNYFRSCDREIGDWALYSFGPACVYRNDIISIGGFNVGIKEWGYEDIQLFEKFISRKDYDVIRAADPGLLHIYHAHTKCDVIKNNIQRFMCVGAMLNGLASKESLVNYLLNKNYFVL